jgi:hypothetical protein
MLSQSPERGFVLHFLRLCPRASLQEQVAFCVSGGRVGTKGAGQALGVLGSSLGLNTGDGTPVACAILQAGTFLGSWADIRVIWAPRNKVLLSLQRCFLHRGPSEPVSSDTWAACSQGECP